MTPRQKTKSEYDRDCNSGIGGAVRSLALLASSTEQISSSLGDSDIVGIVTSQSEDTTCSSTSSISADTIIVECTAISHDATFGLQKRSASSSSRSPRTDAGSRVHPQQIASSKEISSRLKTKGNAAKERSREMHDYFNILALPFVILATWIDWDFSTIFTNGIEASYIGQHFAVTLSATALYFFTDLMWVYYIPCSVKSPSVILNHHCIAIAYLAVPILYPEYRWFMGACLSVEINTWFLILRRVVYKHHGSSSGVVIPQLILSLVTFCFYSSWILIRCILYPCLLLTFGQMAVSLIRATGVYWHWPMLSIPVHFGLCALNLKWTYDLFYPLLVRSKQHGVGKPAVISSGL